MSRGEILGDIFNETAQVGLGALATAVTYEISYQVGGPEVAEVVGPLTGVYIGSALALKYAEYGYHASYGSVRFLARALHFISWESGVSSLGALTGYYFNGPEGAAYGAATGAFLAAVLNLNSSSTAGEQPQQILKTA
jgi:hypothetical protein